MKFKKGDPKKTLKPNAVSEYPIVEEIISKINTIGTGKSKSE
jgi:hypothetical protein